MAKINTTNYQPVTAWNGTQDLFIVEQPDGTKVATPEQVKQYVEAGDFEATGEVIDGHGNILAKKADVTTVTIPAFTPSQAGWRRICKVTSNTVGSGLVYFGGSYSSGQPTSAIIGINIQYDYPTLVLLSSGNNSGVASKIRLVRVAGRVYWLDVYFPVYSGSHGPLTLKFTGDLVISDIQNPISITTDTTEASAELSLNTAISGTVLTDESGLITGDSWEIINIRDKSRVSCYGFTGTISDFAMCGEYTGNAIIISLSVYITNANFTNIQTPSVKIEYPEYTNKSRAYQLYGGAFGNAADLNAIYQNRGENMWLDAAKNVQHLTLTKQNFFKNAVNGVVLINIPCVIIPATKN